MKPIFFLKKLVKKDKLTLVDTNKNLSESYSQKSSNSIMAAKLLFENSLLEESISMIYYAMYNELLSLLFKVGIKSENHTGSILLLQELFEVSNEAILFAKKERIDKQYYADFNVIKEDVEELFSIAEKFIAEISFFKETLDSQKIHTLRALFSENYL